MTTTIMIDKVALRPGAWREGVGTRINSQTDFPRYDLVGALVSLLDQYDTAYQTLLAEAQTAKKELLDEQTRHIEPAPTVPSNPRTADGRVGQSGASRPGRGGPGKTRRSPQR